MKNITKILITILVTLLIIVSTLYYTFYFSPNHYVYRYETLTSTQIPSQMDGIKIVFFSDLEYGTFVNEERLSKIVDKINNSGCDVVIFGGDLYDEKATIDDTNKQTLITYLTKINASLGKFCVYGDNDKISEERLNTINDIYKQSNFEVLNNKVTSLHNKGSESITLVGLDNEVNGTLDLNNTFSSVSKESYTITVCHTPDTADKIPTDLTDYFLAGHSHGGQANFLIKSLYQPSYAKNYTRGKTTISSKFTLDITNGVGTSDKDLRLFADQEIVVYTLHHTDSETN